MIELRQGSKPDSHLVDELKACWQRVLVRPEVGFAKIPSRTGDWDAIEKRSNEVIQTKRLIVVGIGGSSLGTQVLYDCFKLVSAIEVYFLEAPDANRWKLLRQLGPDWQEAHIAIVSKSGGTLETLAWAEKLGAQDPTWLNPTNCTLIASPGHGALQTWAEKNRVHTLTIPENIGGRFSVLTACGMFPAGLMGLSLFEFRQGAAWALENVDLASHLSASILTSWKREEWITQLWTYSENLRMFGQWWQQLWGESLAKRVKRDGSPAPRASTPMSCMGSRDHHSLLQQLIDGYRDKHVLITRVKSTEAGGEVFTPNIFSEAPFYQKPTTLGRILGSQAEAFERSLIEREIGFDALELESLTEKGLGAFFMLWQMVIAQLGEYLEINAFDQPGVESGKRHAEKILRR